MIVVKLISGLGNQLFQYAVARQVSLKTDQELKLDLSFFGSQSLRSFKLNHYNIQAEIATEEELQRFMDRYNNRSLFTRVTRKAGQLLPRRTRRLFQEKQEWQYDPEIAALQGSKYMVGYWQHHKYVEALNPKIFEELRVCEKDKLPFTREYSEILADQNSISLHVRRGDYITDPEASAKIGTLSLSYYERAIDFVVKQNPLASFYIFSDDLEWVKQHLRINNPVKYVEIDNGQRDYIELELMSLCRHNIIANSSFSWWGAFLNRNPSKIVVAPGAWVKDVALNNSISIQMPGWTKL